MFPYQDAKQDVEARIADLVGRMTVAEKIGQCIMGCVGFFTSEKDAFDTVRAGRLGSLILSSTPWPGNSCASGIDIGFLNRCQKEAFENSRLGIPLIYGRDIIHGHYTISPIPLAQAASFDPEVAETSAALGAAEAAGEGVHWTFAPMVDICRDSRWGRVIETFGEDPCLASRMAEGAVRGYQGKDPGSKGHVVACAKHFAGYGFAEGGRDYDAAEFSRYTLHNVILKPFKAALGAGVGSFMSGFQVNGGTPASGSVYLLRKVLREKWQAKAAVVSDFGSVDEIELHGGAQDERDCTKRAFEAGVEIEMCNERYPEYLPGLFESGELDIRLLDEAVSDVLRMKFRAGLFEHPYIVDDPSVQRTAEAKAEVRRIAADCMVLAKNDGGVLPLKNLKGKTIALIGPMLFERQSLLGAWAGSGDAKNTANFFEAFTSALKDSGCKILSTQSALTDEQVIQAIPADLVVCCVGESHMVTGETNGSMKLSLPPGQNELIEAVAAFGRPLIVVNFSGRPLPLPAAEAHAQAILYAWHGGSECANAAADVLLGREPGGRFPITVVREPGVLPYYYGRKIVGKVTKPFLADRKFQFYTDGNIEPYHVFGSGMSYAAFALTEARLDRTGIRFGESNTVRATVVNTAACAGKTVIQCYLRDPRASFVRPGKELIGFAKLELQPGESREVVFEIAPAAMGFLDEDGNFLLEAGTFEIGVGFDSNAALDLSFELKQA